MVGSDVVATMVALATGILGGGAGAAFWAGFFKRNTDRADAANAISQGAVGLLTRADKEIAKLEKSNGELKAVAGPLLDAAEQMLPLLPTGDPRAAAWAKAIHDARLVL
ncbi:hypothetical protein SEA_TYPHA_35 [Mycobacterium phage Typha]|uniref:Uncharacterized protein n=1 Tax=Mycobacterium phage Typha TaxID=2517971 RepID=A0A482JDL1_9CAUD|nr:hypothetical protein KCH40_gp035 [Mycobacterium phage Typha]QBP29692.1 hypothetical protein SEA_TYPHA_35 [Mycobacterium phage Typha]URM86479.1 hypothetical protein PBI_HILLTOPFARM_35 [Mycobacterium phage Hilltopfarm]